MGRAHSGKQRLERALEQGEGRCARGRLEWVDGTFGSNLQANIDPLLGNVAIAVALNEFIEPIRLPLVVATTPAVVRTLRSLRG